MTTAETPATTLDPAALAAFTRAQSDFADNIRAAADFAFSRTGATAETALQAGADPDQVILFERGRAVGVLEGVLRAGHDPESGLDVEVLVEIASKIFLDRVAELEAAAALPVAGRA